jgi:hypothetical protein
MARYNFGALFAWWLAEGQGNKQWLLEAIDSFPSTSTRTRTSTISASKAILGKILARKQNFDPA